MDKVGNGLSCSNFVYSHLHLYLQRSPFGAPFLSIVKTITMSQGEFDFDDNFALEPEGTIAYPNTTFIIWLIFLVLMSLLLQNLLVSCI